MTEKVWRALGEMTQPDGASGDQALLEHLAAAVAELHLPPSLLERVQAAATEAIRRARQRDADRAVCVTITAHALQPEIGQSGQSWGFFLIEKRAGLTADRRIDVLLYPEAR